MDLKMDFLRIKKSGIETPDLMYTYFANIFSQKVEG